MHVYKQYYCETIIVELYRKKIGWDKRRTFFFSFLPVKLWVSEIIGSFVIQYQQQIDQYYIICIQRQWLGRFVKITYACITIHKLYACIVYYLWRCVLLFSTIIYGWCTSINLMGVITFRIDMCFSIQDFISYTLCFLQEIVFQYDFSQIAIFYHVDQCSLFSHSRQFLQFLGVHIYYYIYSICIYNIQYDYAQVVVSFL
eukprot:TRINITY_DN1858_c0_g1_i6.p4 TRINITY_DN1858_c0_g1~~TRINITY_DN1858_c0_g1_i6.p4  ORF type:complete len:200 (-),score=-26.66 TRINITY_DN1858_c0_g1_i6:1258-1857(-)